MNDRPVSEQRAAIWQKMRVPTAALFAELGLLACIVALGHFMPGRAASFIEAGLTVSMAGTVMLFSMEVREESSLLRFYSFLGFCWLAVLMGMTMLDYFTRG